MWSSIVYNTNGPSEKKIVKANRLTFDKTAIKESTFRIPYHIPIS